MAVASDVMDTVRALLNDVAADVLTNTIQLPYVKIANDELSDALVKNSIPVIKEVSADIDLAASSTELTLPSDIITPISVFEKNDGEAVDKYVELEKRDFLPEEIESEFLRFWTWREQKILFLGATVAKDIRLKYNRAITTITSPSSTVEATGSLFYLAFKTAEHISRSINQNSIKAAEMRVMAEEKLNDLLTIAGKPNQGLVVRRRPHRVNRARTY